MLYLESLQELENKHNTGKVDKNKKTRTWGKVEGMWIPLTEDEKKEAKQEARRNSWLNDRKH